MLRVLECYSLQFDDELDTIALFERLPSLETLLFWVSTAVFNIPRILFCLKRLKVLNLHNVQLKWSDDCMPISLLAESSVLERVILDGRGDANYELLSVFAPIPTLKHFFMTYDCGWSTRNDNGMHQFAEVLNGKKLETLHIHGVRRIPFILLDTLGNLPNLRVLELNGFFDDNCNLVTTTVPMLGLLQLLTKTMSLKTICLSQITLKNGQKTYTRKDVIGLFKQKALNYRFETYSFDVPQLQTMSISVVTFYAMFVSLQCSSSFSLLLYVVNVYAPYQYLLRNAYFYKCIRVCAECSPVQQNK